VVARWLRCARCNPEVNDMCTRWLKHTLSKSEAAEVAERVPKVPKSIETGARLLRCVLCVYEMPKVY
jgi:hypothetical protein